jgi:hypothetical protein
MKTMPELLSHGCPTPEHNFAELQVGPVSVRGHSLGRGVRSVHASAVTVPETGKMGTMIGAIGLVTFYCKLFLSTTVNKNQMLVFAKRFMPIIGHGLVRPRPVPFLKYRAVDKKKVDLT